MYLTTLALLPRRSVANYWGLPLPPFSTTFSGAPCPAPIVCCSGSVWPREMYFTAAGKGGDGWQVLANQACGGIVLFSGLKPSGINSGARASTMRGRAGVTFQGRGFKPHNRGILQHSECRIPRFGVRFPPVALLDFWFVSYPSQAIPGVGGTSTPLSITVIPRGGVLLTSVTTRGGPLPPPTPGYHRLY